MKISEVNGGAGMTAGGAAVSGSTVSGSSEKEKLLKAENAAAETKEAVAESWALPAAVYTPEEADKSSYMLYDRSRTVYGTAASGRSTETNRIIQNNLKLLGFYSGDVSSDGNLESAESVKAIANFRRVYGIGSTGGMDTVTQARLDMVLECYHNTMNDPDLTGVAQLAGNQTAGYNEGLIKNNVAKIWAFLKVGMGLNNVHAAGVMGNILHESGAVSNNAYNTFYPGLQNPEYSYSVTDGIAYGIIQWMDSSRKQGLLNTAGEMGLSVGDLNAQLAYFRRETEDNSIGAWNSLKQTTDVESAAKVFQNDFEICGDGTEDRKNKAIAVYGALG